MEPEILFMLLILILTIVLLVLDWVRIDLLAILVMLSLGWAGILTVEEMFTGFSSQAVMAMIGIMLMSYGLAESGLVAIASRWLTDQLGSRRWKLLLLVLMLVAGLMSGLIITIGVAVLFIPVLLNIARRLKRSPSALFIPVGFAAILGANLTIVGSAPLIMVNDLLAGFQLESYGFFSVTPVGILLLISGLAYFSVAGKRLLPGSASQEETRSPQAVLTEKLQLPQQISSFLIPDASSLIGRSLEESQLWLQYDLHLLGWQDDGQVEFVPWRHSRFAAGQTILLLGEKQSAHRFASDWGLTDNLPGPRLSSLTDFSLSGFAEVVILPRSGMAGSSLRKYGLRRQYKVEPIILYHGSQEIRTDFSDVTLEQGDVLVIFGRWEDIDQLSQGGDFLVVTPYEKQPVYDRRKAALAVTCFLAAIGLTMAGIPLSLAFFSSALVLIFAGVVPRPDIYKAIDWKVIFTLAGLIPLGLAMQKTGTAIWLADRLFLRFSDLHPIGILAAVAVLTSFVTLFMSNVGAVVLIAPLVTHLAMTQGLDPRPLILMTAVCASNSFLLPTHQVNAVMLTPGGYKNRDFIRAGGGITLIYLLITVIYFYFVMI